jgi:MFS family permease
MGIGGEYAAINSAIDEMIPARYRGRIDLAVNGTYWGGALIGTVITLFVLNHVDAEWGWRIAYLAGPVLALSIIYVRRNLPESPRWQIMHGRQEEAEGSIKEIEDQDRNTLFAGYVVGAVAMMPGGLAAVFPGVNAEGRSLEDVATPLSVVGKPPQTIFRGGDDRSGGAAPA